MAIDVFCDTCDDTGKITITVSPMSPMGSGIRSCPDCPGRVEVPVLAVRALLSDGGFFPTEKRMAVELLSVLLPKPRCPATVNPYPGGPAGVRRMQCEGTEGHAGPHQLADDAWMVPK